MIEIEHLTKRYGTLTAVSDLSLQIGSGQIYGFLGPNGAGKSTTLNIMTGCLSATEGHVRIGGYDIFEEPKRAKRLIGYLPEQPPLYLGDSPLEQLRFAGEAKGLRGRELSGQIDAVVEQTGIGQVRGRRIAELSKGYRQRLGIAQALLGRPKVIILDEPTVGLDPIQIIEIRDLIRQLGKEHTVIFSSHILSEVQTICDQILMIAHGRLVAFDRPENLEKRLLSPNEITLSTDAGPDEALSLLSSLEHLTQTEVTGTEDGVTTLRIKTDARDIYAVSRSIFFAFARGDKALLEMSLKKANLEDIFLELTEHAPADAVQGEQEVNDL